MPPQHNELVRWFDDLGQGDVPQVGGKNASLGEMIARLKDRGVRVPDGFATTARAYRRFLEHNDLAGRIREQLGRLDDRGDGEKLHDVGQAIREMIGQGDFDDTLREAIGRAYRELSRRYDADALDVAVRSSATAEDLPEASFAGQQESFLNVTGEADLLDACRRCFASLFTDRAISYRVEHGFDHMAVALSVGVQKMVRSDRAGAGVMFTIDTETGFEDLVLIDAAFGLGDSVVKGIVNPDEYRVFSPLLDREGLRPIIGRSIGKKQTKSVYGEGGRTTRRIDTPPEQRRRAVLSDDEILTLARWGRLIARHYGRPMDIEWAQDGEGGPLYIVQARPETVQSRKQAATLKNYRLTQDGPPLVEGVAVGRAIAAGRAFVLAGVEQADRFEDGGILVTDMTDPDWVPIMRRAGGVVTDHGGRTSHAAIVSRELGVPAVIGTGDATAKIDDGGDVTISCAQGETGVVYAGRLDFEQQEIDPRDVPATRTKVMMNLASPEAALRWWNLPADGIGLARVEFVIGNAIKIHPLALTRFDQLDDAEAKEHIRQITEGYADRTDYFVEQLALGIAQIAVAQYPKPVIVRLSDFKTNEYAGLIGGRQFEPEESNPMLGFRGAARYRHDRYRDGFALECQALRRVRERIGMDNVIAMVPFCRTPDEADGVLDAMAEHGLVRGRDGFKVYVMAETPSNIVLADQFAARFDGFSIGTNDLTQLTLGVDRDSELLADLFDARNEAVRRMIRMLIDHAHDAGVPVSLCGQAPSDHPGFAQFLVESGIDSISVNPDSVIDVRRQVARAEQKQPSSAPRR